MCFMPTMDEFRDFSAFVSYMEDQGAHKCGVAKVYLPIRPACMRSTATAAGLVLHCLLYFIRSSHPRNGAHGGAMQTLGQQ